MSLVVRPWRGLEAFAALAPAWDALVRAGGLDPLCNAHAWCLAHARAYSDASEVLGWSFEEHGEPRGIIALRREPLRNPVALRRALFLADGTFDSDYLEPPIEPGREREIAGLLVDAARAERGLEALVLAGLPDGSRFLAALRAELEQRDLPRREHALVCLAAPLADTLEGALASLKPRMRSKVRSAMRAAGERGARVSWCERADELEPWLAELYRLHELRWRAAGRPGSFADSRRCTFYADFAAAALARGELCFARLDEPGGVRALQLGVRVGARYYQIQEGYDPAFEAVRVGTALRGLALGELIARGVRAYDFMAGDSGHKRDWGAQPRPCTTIAFPLPRWRPTLVYRLRAQVERMRSTRSAEDAQALSEGLNEDGRGSFFRTERR